MTTKFRAASICVFALLLFADPAGAVVSGQVDTFQDGTTMGWTNGGIIAEPVTNIADGGPLGAGDHYIQLTATGSGSGGKLTAFNFMQWIGNYIAQGITAIQIDLINQSAVDLSIRLAFKSGTGQTPGYLSGPMLLPVGSGWQHFTLSITEANMIPLLSPGPYSTFFGNVGELRIINEVGTSNLNGDPIIGQLGIDNIRAIPEPSAIGLAVAALASFGACRLRSKQRSAR